MAHHFNSEKLPGNGLTRTLTMGAFLISAAMAAEKHATDEEHRRLNPEAKVASTLREGEKAVYILPGCRADGMYIGQMLDPHVQHLGSTHHLAYAERDFSLDSVKSALLDARAKDDDRPAIIYASSMGGMVICSLLLDEEFREKFGKIDKIIFDSSPADADDLDSGTRFAMLAASVLPPSWSIAHLYRNFMRRGAKRSPAHAPEVTDEQAKGHLLSSANTHLSAVKGEAHFIDTTKFHENQLADATKHVGNFIYIGASHDHMVNQEIAHQKFARAFGRSVLRVVDWDRQKGSHAAGPEFPRTIARLMEESVIPPTPDNDRGARAVSLFRNSFMTQQSKAA